MIKRIRLELLLVIAQLLLPRGVCICHLVGAYTQRWGCVYGVLDNRGVMQGRSIQDLIREEI